MKKLFLIAIILLTIVSCKNKNEPEPYTKTECDSGTVDFVNQVKPILLSSCATSGCHNSATAKEGVVLDSYDNMMKTIGINKGNAASSELYKVLNDSGDDLMPPPSSGMSLTATQKNIIKDWINQGAKNIECTNFSSCDTSSFQFASDVKPLLDASCVSCHNTGSTNGTVLATYNDVKANVDNGKLLASIMHSTGTSPMPKDLDKWDDCKIAIVKKWINAGAQNN